MNKTRGLTIERKCEHVNKAAFDDIVVRERKNLFKMSNSEISQVFDEGREENDKKRTV